MQKESIEKKESDLEIFRQEMLAKKNDELAKKERGERHDSDWERIDPADLEEEDMIIYRKYCAGIVSSDFSHDFQTYKELALGEEEDSRKEFRAWLRTIILRDLALNKKIK